MVGELREGLPSGAKASWPAEWEKDGRRGVHSRVYWNVEWDQSRNFAFDNPSDAVSSHRRSPCSWCNEDDHK